MDAIKPDTVRFGAIGIRIGKRGRNSAAVPSFTADRTGMAADASVEVDHEAQFFCGCLCRKIRHGPDLKFAPYFRMAGVPPGDTFPGSASNCGELSVASSGVAFSIFTRKSNHAA